MEKRLLLSLLMALTFNVWAQEDCTPGGADVYLEANNIRALIDPSGSLFWDGDNARFTFEGPQNEALATIFAQGLWIGGNDAGGNLYLSAAQYGKSIGNYDYYPGPIFVDDVISETYPDLEHCTDWNKTWTVQGQQVLSHILDFEDNGVINSPIPAIFDWPGRGNDNLGFLEGNLNGYAPFWDRNGDGIYSPQEGDYPIIIQESGTPLPIPEQMTWCIFHSGIGAANDSGAGSKPLLEIHLTTWAYNCSEDDILNNTIFTSYKINSRSIEPLLNTKVGFWHDFDLGCYTDDYIGSAPDQNTFFVYNASNVDAFCPPVNSAGENPPVQSVTILNRSLDKFIYMNNQSVGSSPFGTTDPSSVSEFYNYLSGQFRDGTPLTEGGSGYNSGGESTDFAFPGDPNVAGDWSEYEFSVGAADRRVLGVVNIPDSLMQPFGSVRIDLAYTYHREPNASHLENVSAMYDNVAAIQAMYDVGFENGCGLGTATSEPTWANEVKLFPNPVYDQLNINFGKANIEKLQVWDNLGHLIMTFDEPKQVIDMSSLSAGIYYLRLNSNDGSVVRKFIKMK